MNPRIPEQEPCSALSCGKCWQEFFFHCMAGREGLVDTAVKTSRSGRVRVPGLGLMKKTEYTDSRISP